MAMLKRIVKSFAAAFLGFFAYAIIRRYRPKVVMVSGSVGKTSTKDAAAAALAPRFFVRKSEKNFNTEFGVPYAIFGVKKDPGRNLFAWTGIAKSVLALLLLPNHFPNLLVLEVGAEEPGDLARILRIVTPDAVVITRLPEIPVHVEAYASPEAVREEEFSPAYALPAGAPLIVCADDLYALEAARGTSARVMTYGVSKDANIRVSAIDFYEEEEKVAGMHAIVSEGGAQEELVVRGSLGKTQILPAAAALALAAAFSIPTGEALAALAAYEPPPGRSRLFSGRNGSVIIDDSYNSSPAAVEEALATLAAFPRAGRRIAVLGDMLELGRYSVAEHERIGALAGEAANLVVAVGIRAKAFVLAAGEVETMHFDDSFAAAAALPALVRAGDVILVKGSQSIRTERIVWALLADLDDASRLVRQEKRWKRKA